MAQGKVMPSFDEFIKQGRKQRRNQELADEIFGKSKTRPATKASGSGIGNSRAAPIAPGAALANRIGGGPKYPTPTGFRPNINSRLTHAIRKTTAPTTRNAAPRRPAATAAIADAVLDQGVAVRGRASATTVIASNFAPDTTAADIREVMGPHGGEMLSCRLVSTRPTVIAEIVFARREGAQAVVDMFNNKRADGRLLYVYINEPVAGNTAAVAPAPSARAHPPTSSSSTSYYYADNRTRSFNKDNTYTNNGHDDDNAGMDIDPIDDHHNTTTNNNGYYYHSDVDTRNPHPQQQQHNSHNRRAAPAIQDGRYGFDSSHISRNGNGTTSGGGRTYTNGTTRSREDYGLVSDRLVGSSDGRDPRDQDQDPAAMQVEMDAGAAAHVAPPSGPRRRGGGDGEFVADRRGGGRGMGRGRGQGLGQGRYWQRR